MIHNAFHGEGLGFENADFSFSITQANYEDSVFSYSADGRIGLNEDLEEIEKRVAVGLKNNFEMEAIPPHYVDENSEIVQMLLKVYDEMTGNVDKLLS